MHVADVVYNVEHVKRPWFLYKKTRLLWEDLRHVGCRSRSNRTTAKLYIADVQHTTEWTWWSHLMAVSWRDSCSCERREWFCSFALFISSIQHTHGGAYKSQTHMLYTDRAIGHFMETISINHPLQ